MTTTAAGAFSEELVQVADVPIQLRRAAAQGQREQRRVSVANITSGGPSLDYETAHATYQIVSGNPATVIKKLKHIMDLVDPGYLILRAGKGRCPTAWPCAPLTC